MSQCVTMTLCPLTLQQVKNPGQVTMATSFTRMMSGRNTAVILASIGAGTLASGYLLSDSTAAAERRRLYPARYVCEYVYVKCVNNHLLRQPISLLQL